MKSEHLIRRLIVGILVAGGVPALAVAFGVGRADDSVAGTHAAPSLYLPISCDLGVDCFIQNLVDDDPGSGAVDYKCGSLTYDGHKGVDFRVPSLRQGLRTPVKAALDGEVLRVRDGMNDISAKLIGRKAIKGRECGNGVVIAHRDGWQTQYCHLAKSSILVRPGERVSHGQTIGRVGMSGFAEFPHLHFSLSHNGKIVDPFAFGADAPCVQGNELWNTKIRSVLRYRLGFIVNLGFSDRKVDINEVMDGALDEFHIQSNTPALLAVAVVGAMRRDDSFTFSLEGPDGKVLARKVIDRFPRPMAQFLFMIGKHRPEGGWPKGAYKTTLTVSHAGAVKSSKQSVITY